MPKIENISKQFAMGYERRKSSRQLILKLVGKRSDKIIEEYEAQVKEYLKNEKGISQIM